MIPEIRTRPVTKNIAESWSEACEDWKNIGLEDEYTEEEWQARYVGYEPEWVCDWEVVGFDPQDALTLAASLSELASRVRNLISIIEYYRSLDTTVLVPTIEQK